ncbi:unnamed protein product [Calypogeia fissa]
MAVESSLLPGLEDAVLLGGLKEMQILTATTTWTIVHAPGMEFPLEPNLPKFQFTSNGLEKRARTDYLSMHDYMTNVYVPKPSDVHPKPHAKVGASQYRSMLDYMLTEHRAQVKRRSRGVYERPSVIYKRGLPSGKAYGKQNGTESSDAKGKGVRESSAIKDKGVTERFDEEGKHVIESSQDKDKEVETKTQELVVQHEEGYETYMTLRKSQLLSSKSDGEEVASVPVDSETLHPNSQEIEQLEEDSKIIENELRVLDEIGDDNQDD